MKLILLVIIISLLSFPSYSQILNSSFEDWSGGEPLFWNTSNFPPPAPSHANVTQTSHAYEGSSAVMGEVTLATDVIYGGGTFVYYPKLTTFGEDDAAGFPIAGRPGFLRGYFLYEPVGEGGYFSIDIILTKWMGNEDGRMWIGSAGQFINNTIFLDTAYTELVIPISYFSTDQPDTVMITMGIGSGEVGSKFYVDNLSLSFIEIIEPEAKELVVSGQKDTIKWYESNTDIDLLYSLDEGKTYETIVNNYPGEAGEFIWDVPEELLSAKAIIRIEDSQDNSQFYEQPVRIKPYVITRLDENGDYIAYDIMKDRWGFDNSEEGVWPESWWSRFDYVNGIDPFTQQVYDFMFSNIVPSRHMDWVSFVNTFGTDACYIDLEKAVYSSTARRRWRSVSEPWGGACFGIAIANALAFQKKDEFLAHYPDFPEFSDPISINGSENTFPVINELYTHQYGNPHSDLQDENKQNKSPAQTINDMINMLREDNVKIRTLGFFNNDSTTGGGHAILAYKLVKDKNSEDLYHVHVYDNSHPNTTNAEILVDIKANTWQPQYAWQSWGGTKWFLLDDPAEGYLDTDSLTRMQTLSSPFIQNDDEVQIFQNSISFVLISNSQNQRLGFSGRMFSEIENANMIIAKNGSTGPPQGYKLPVDNYSIQTSGFESDGISLSFFTGNKVFGYDRTDAGIQQSDRLFFDGGISAANPDAETKNISLLHIINEITQEKVFTVYDLTLGQGDSVKISNPDDNNLDFESYGTAKNYSIDIENPSESGLKRFRHTSIPISGSALHKIIPQWNGLDELNLKILIDENNDGTIDDSLSLENQVTGTGDDQGFLSTPDTYNLSQNYPNPFNPATVIKYQIPVNGFVSLKIYDILGKEIATLVNEEKSAGRYEANFNASALSSGVYIYQLKVNEFVSTKKMVLLK